MNLNSRSVLQKREQGMGSDTNGHSEMKYCIFKFKYSENLDRMLLNNSTTVLDHQFLGINS